MAIARCEKCGKPTGAKVKPPGYVNQPYLPMGHPSSGVICGKPNCENDALIWLKIDEALAWRPELMAVVLSLFVAIVVLALESLAPVLVVPCGYGGLHGNVGDF